MESDFGKNIQDMLSSVQQPPKKGATAEESIRYMEGLIKASLEKEKLND